MITGMAQAQVTRTPSSPADAAGVPIADYLALGSDQAAEVIDGELIMMSPQKVENTDIAHELVFSIEAFIHGKKLGRVYTEATYALDINERKGRVRGSLVPDVSFLSQKKYEEQIKKYGKRDFFRLAPEFVIEVVSEDDRYSEINRKVALYLQYGTQLVWVIDPQQGNARVITPDQPAGQIMAHDSTLSGEPVLPGWSIRLSELLGGDQ